MKWKFPTSRLDLISYEENMLLLCVSHVRLETCVANRKMTYFLWSPGPALFCQVNCCLQFGNARENLNLLFLYLMRLMTMMKTNWYLRTLF
jgi:hypothetical protein